MMGYVFNLIEEDVLLLQLPQHVLILAEVQNEVLHHLPVKLVNLRSDHLLIYYQSIRICARAAVQRQRSAGGKHRQALVVG